MWYLVIAEGGTERGHAVSVARSTSPAGPFDPHPRNPIFTARGTTRKVQCTGHGDLVQTGDGDWKLVHLGTWAEGQAYRFAPLGRETYLTDVTWQDGWPVIAPLLAETRTPLAPWNDDFGGDTLGPEWIAMRRLPTSLARVEDGHLVIDGEGRTMDDRKATFVGRRLTHVHGRVAANVGSAAEDKVGGLALRIDERHHLDVEVQPRRVVARLVLSTIRVEHEAPIEAGPVELALHMREPHPRSPSSDLIDVEVTQGGDRQVLATFDGRYLSVETTCSFVGRVVGLYCTTGRLIVDRYEERDS